MARSIKKPVPADNHRIPIDSNKIRELRQSLNLSQVDLAKRAKLASSQIVSDIEGGKRRQNLTIETLDRIAAALGVKAKDLLK